MFCMHSFNFCMLFYFVLRSRGAEVDHSGSEVSYCCAVGQTGASGQEEGQTSAEVSEEL